MLTVHTTGSNGLTLFLDSEELSRMGRERLDEPTALVLVRSALRNMGVSADPLEISAFVGKSGAMVVALLDDCQATDEPRMWAFYRLADTDALLALLSLYRRQRPFKIYGLDGAFYIAIREHKRDFPPTVSEFGSRVYKPQSFLIFLEEHGKRV